jgi:small GTP-binding protein
MMIVSHPNRPDNYSLLNVAVVGHTNTGKTSLIRTMLRSTEFGVIEDAAGTTRHVEQAAISADNEPILNLYDTPGLEDSRALAAHIRKLHTKLKSLPPAQILEHFVTHVSINDPLEQEAKVIRQILRSDILLYIIDVREPFLEKYRLELDILTQSAKPMIPVFNFIAGHNQELAKWRQHLAMYNIHATLEFDTVAFTFEAEKRLYQKIQSLVESHYTPLQKLIDHRAKLWNQLCLSGAKRVTELIVNVACYRESKATQNNRIADSLTEDRLHDFVRKAEQRCLHDLLSIFNFSEKDVAIQKIPVSNGHWQLDIFAPGILKAYGLDVGSAAAKGAAAGAGIDLMVGGMSLGAASALGAIAGAGWSTFRRYGDEIKATVQGAKWQCADETTLQILYLRQKHLLKKLMHRGHAAQDTMKVDTADTEKLPDNWSKLTSALRQNPAWQEPTVTRNNNPQYQEIEAKLVGALLDEG